LPTQGPLQAARRGIRAHDARALPSRSRASPSKPLRSSSPSPRDPCMSSRGREIFRSGWPTGRATETQCLEHLPRTCAPVGFRRFQVPKGVVPHSVSSKPVARGPIQG
jgi:hypothetical protein